MVWGLGFRGTFKGGSSLGVLLMRIIVFWGPHISGNSHLGTWTLSEDLGFRAEGLVHIFMRVLSPKLSEHEESVW